MHPEAFVPNLVSVRHSHLHNIPPPYTFKCKHLPHSCRPPPLPHNPGTHTNNYSVFVEKLCLCTPLMCTEKWKWWHIRMLHQFSIHSQLQLCLIGRTAAKLLLLMPCNLLLLPTLNETHTILYSNYVSYGQVRKFKPMVFHKIIRDLFHGSKNSNVELEVIFVSTRKCTINIWV